jgi:hypothetical protein
MGVYPSKPSSITSQKSVNTNVSKAEVSQHLTELQQALELFSKNDILVNIQNMKVFDQLDTKTKDYISTVIKSLDQQVLLEIKNGNTTKISEIDHGNFEEAVKEKLKPYSLLLNPSNPDAGVKKVIEAFKPCREMRGKYIYYQYKYIELNIFIIVFALKMKDVYTTSISNVIAEVAAKQQKDRDLLKDFIELSGKLTTVSTDGKEINMKEITELGRQAYNNINDSYSQIIKRLEEMEKGNLSEVIKTLLDGNEQLQTTIAQHLASKATI